MGLATGPAPRSEPEFEGGWLWAAEWSDGRMTVMMAPNESTARSSQPDMGVAILENLSPVRSMVLRVTGRANRNAPGGGHVRTPLRIQGRPVSRRWPSLIRESS
jgi:hypothetical protein